MNNRLASGLFLLCVGLFASAASADTIERNFDVGASGKLDIRSDVGSIDITTNNRGRVEVVVRRDGRDADDFEVNMRQEGSTIRVTGEMPNRGGRWNSHDLDVDFQVSVPKGFNLELQTSGGSIDVDDLDGEVIAQTAGGHLNFGEMGASVEGRTAGGGIRLRSAAQAIDLKTAGGSIKIGDVQGDARVRTAGGSIDVGDIDGNLTATTAGGSIDIGRVQGTTEARTAGGSIDVQEAWQQVRAETSGGSVQVHFAGQPSGNSRIESQGGSVTVALAPGLAFDVDARSGHGRIRSDFDFPASAYDDPKERTSLRADLNGGGPRMSLYASQRVALRRH